MRKRCSGCRKRKALSQFDHHHKGRHGRHPRCKACRAIYSRKRYQRIGKAPHDPDKYRRYRHGLTKEDFAAAKKRQKGKCGICRQRKPLVIDHCHKTKKFRGLLCGRCNTGLGKLGDDIAGLKLALLYLQPG